MSTKRGALTAKKACTRCSTQKRRCDKALPACGLCTRLRQTCKYEVPPMSSSGPTPSPSPASEKSLGVGVFTESQLKDIIVQRLEHLTPEDVLSIYCQAIEPWFPIISIPKLRGWLPQTWDAAPTDVVLFCLSILLLSTSPSPSANDENEHSESKALYIFTKSSLASAEGLGINTFLVVQARLLVTLFEVAHGFYPAAYISIGSTIRAADALEVRPDIDTSSSSSLSGGAKQEGALLMWSGILVLDRYIAVESGSRPSLTRLRTQSFLDLLKPTMCPTHDRNQDHTSPIARIARIFEASLLLDKIHNAIEAVDRPTPEVIFDKDELVLTVQALVNLQTLLNEEIGDGIPLYSGGVTFCQIALLLAFENGSKAPLSANVTELCNSMAMTSLMTVLSTIASTLEPFATGEQSIDFNIFPPFVAFMVYKAASVVTERIWMVNDSARWVKTLKILRNFLNIVAARWLSCERYIKLLNEDTTPRILKAIGQG